MKNFKKLMSLTLALIIFTTAFISAFAYEGIDMTKTGTINVTMKDGKGKPVGGGELTLYKVGDIRHNNGDYSFVPVDELIDAGWTGNFFVLEDKDVPVDLQEFIKDKKVNLTVVTEKINKDGNVSFSALELGLYLAVQNKAANGYNKANSFLVSVPHYDEMLGKYVYTVDASPKVEVDRKPDRTPTPTPTSTIPNTGVNNYAVPSLAIPGLVLFALGWYMCFGRRNKNEE